MTFLLNNTLSHIILNDLKDTRSVPFLAGEPGTGKTSIIQGLEELPDTKVFTISVNTLADKGDLTGARTLQDPEDGKWKQMFFPHETFVAANKYAVDHPEATVIVLLDEINRADSDVTSACMTISTERRVGTTKLAPNIRIVVTGNLTGNVTHLDSASLTRFSIYEVKPSAQVFLDLMGTNLNKYIRTVLTKYPDYVFLKPTAATSLITSTDNDDDDDLAATSEKHMMDFSAALGSDQDMVQFTTPRTIEGLSIWLNNSDFDFLKELLTTTIDGGSRSKTMLQSVLEAHTGDTAFTAEVLSEMTNDLLTVQAQTTKTLVKPAAYDSLAAAVDNNELERLVRGLTTDEQADVLLYALRDDINQAALNIIPAIIAPGALDHFPRSKMYELINLGAIPQRNFDALTSRDSTLTDQLGAGILGLLGDL